MKAGLKKLNKGDEEEKEVEVRKLDAYMRMDPKAGNRITAAR